MLRLKLILLLLTTSVILFSQNYLHCTIDVNESSSDKKLNFGVPNYEEPEKYRGKTVKSFSNNKTEIINKMAKEGWELEKIDNNILYFKIDTEQLKKYLYCTIDVNESSSDKKLNFGVPNYEEPEKYRGKTVKSFSNSKTEIINKMAKEGWKLLEEIQFDNQLLFRVNTEQLTKYFYCTVDVNVSSSDKKLNFGVPNYEEPEKYRGKTVKSFSNNKTEIINKMAKEGWELEKIDTNILYFKIDTEQPKNFLYCTVDVNESSSDKKLDFGVPNYEEPEKYRGKTVKSFSNNKTEIINKMAKEGWELEKIDANILYFKIDTEQPKKYLYCTVDVNERWSDKKLDFGVPNYEEPEKYRGKTVKSFSNNKTEIINKMSKQGWELPKDIQFGDKLLFRRID